MVLWSLLLQTKVSPVGGGEGLLLRVETSCTWQATSGLRGVSGGSLPFPLCATKASRRICSAKGFFQG